MKHPKFVGNSQGLGTARGRHGLYCPGEELGGSGTEGWEMTQDEVTQLGVRPSQPLTLLGSSGCCRHLLTPYHRCGAWLAGQDGNFGVSGPGSTWNLMVADHRHTPPGRTWEEVHQPLTLRAPFPWVWLSGPPHTDLFPSPPFFSFVPAGLAKLTGQQIS